MFLVLIFSFLSDILNKIQRKGVIDVTDLWSYLKTVNKPIVLYGIGNGADKVINRLTAENIKVSGVFSSSGFKKNKSFAGHIIKDYETLKAELGDMIILVCFGSHLPEVIQRVKSLALENELYIPDVPVVGEVIFDIDFARNHKESLKAVYEMLADQASKTAFENIVYFKLTGKPRYIFEIETEKIEVYDILKLNNNETFLDLGAYNGDTVLEFIQNTNGYKFITAIEPDKRNFKKLTLNTGNLQNIACINSAVSNENGVQLMSANHGRGNSVSQNTVEVETLSLDSICSELIPTFIKMDVEGNELKAIEGGRAVITTAKPKMHIACYHTSYDLFEIPLKIKELAGDYKIYLRHHSCFPAWDSNYIFTF